MQPVQRVCTSTIYRVFALPQHLSSPLLMPSLPSLLSTPRFVCVITAVAIFMFHSFSNAAKKKVKMKKWKTVLPVAVTTKFSMGNEVANGQGAHSETGVERKVRKACIIFGRVADVSMWQLCCLPRVVVIVLLGVVVVVMQHSQSKRDVPRVSWQAKCIGLLSLKYFGHKDRKALCLFPYPVNGGNSIRYAT